MIRSSSQTHRAKMAKESFQSAAEAIGPVEFGMAVAMLTRGQFSMIDAIRHVLDQVGPSRISVWTWTIAEYEVQVFRDLMLDGRVTGGTLVIDHDVRNTRKSINSHMIREWRQCYGEDSVHYVDNHAKIALIESEGGHKLYLRGSMNLNHNPRFEQADISEGCPAFDMIRAIELELPVLSDDCTADDARRATKTGEAFDLHQLAMFENAGRDWRP